MRWWSHNLGIIIDVHQRRRRSLVPGNPNPNKTKDRRSEAVLFGTWLSRRFHSERHWHGWI